jgi:hypothetical protein
LPESTLGQVTTQNFQNFPRDPGVRGGPAGAGGPLPGLTSAQNAFFGNGLEDFAEAEGVGDGLGPRFNLDGCGGCHVQPATGGSSPAVNPQVAIATAFGAKNKVPSFISSNGPIREARFQKNPDGSPDGGVHALFVISGRVDSTGNASGCTAVQEDFEKQVANAAAGHGVLFTTHDPNHALRAADRAYLLRDGERVAEGKVGEVLTREQLEDLYGAPVEKLTDQATRATAFLPG